MLRGANLAGAARVAAVAMLLIAVVYVALVAAVDAFVARRVLWEVDQRLSAHLAAVRTARDPLSSTSLPDDVGTDGAPLFVWWIAPSGVVTGLTVGEPGLPRAAARSIRTPLSIETAASAFRYVAVRFRSGLLVAAQDLAGPSHIDRVLLIGELVIGPVLLAAVFGGVLVIGMRAAAPVEAARRRLQELTADASHELRTPLTVIEAEIELARSSSPDANADREALEHVARESRRLKAIVEDLLWLARVDADPPAPSGDHADLVAAATAGATRFAAVAIARHLELSSHVTQGPLWVDVPDEWLERLIGTLMDNACRHALGAVRVSAIANGVRAILCVEDDGPGIPASLRDTLFDRFRRAAETPGGAGLGLAIADTVVRSTGGRWNVGTSTMGGARMEVSWRRSIAPPRRVDTGGAHGVDGNSGAGRSVAPTVGT